MEGLAGDRAIEVRFVLALFTVTVADPERDPERAVTVTMPVATPVAVPEALTEAAFEFEELQVTEEVRSFVEPSE
jgi:hypothetical protein